MKSRYNWAIQGDINTAFYHTSTLVRRKRNRIDCIKNHLEEWIHDEEVVAEIIREGFLKLFCTVKTSAPKANWSIPRWPTFLSKESIQKLNLPVTCLEIKAALWSIKPFKAPGPDEIALCPKAIGLGLGLMVLILNYLLPLALLGLKLTLAKRLPSLRNLSYGIHSSFSEFGNYGFKETDAASKISI
ncbi:hypothetical protein SO802_030469 [Lithocarpus litseifolius]|uniref:Uncharacterized protein n=1 Tax=Lithocarpus litseifolius TaxID=425828 RepID=A0AAW2BJE2_9ROSI